MILVLSSLALAGAGQAQPDPGPMSKAVRISAREAGKAAAVRSAGALWIGDNRIENRSRIVKVEGSITVVGFLVEDPKALREGAPLAVQSGEDEKTRAAIPGGPLELKHIKPPDPEELRRFKLPAFQEWLRRE